MDYFSIFFWIDGGSPVGELLSDWWFQTWLLFSISYMGMSSFPLTFTPSFFKMVKLHHQPGWFMALKKRVFSLGKI